MQNRANWAEEAVAADPEVFAEFAQFLFQDFLAEKKKAETRAKRRAKGGVARGRC